MKTPAERFIRNAEQQAAKPAPITGMNQNALAAARRFAEGLVDVPDAEVRKVFFAAWFAPCYTPGSRTVQSTFFSDEQGYDARDRAEIEALPVGRTYRMTNHTITREA